MSISDINSKIAAAVTAQEAGDYATALTQLRSAKMLISGIPDSRGALNGLTWDRNAIDKMITELNRLAAAASVATNGIRRTSVVYRRPRFRRDCEF